MYDHANSIKGSSLSGNSAVPARTRQVESMLDSANFSLDRLESLVEDLGRRLEPVTGGYPEQPLESTGLNPPMVPVAARISFINSRIVTLAARIESSLSALEI